MAKLSVIIPSRDRPESLRRAIESVLGTQGEHDVEIVVVLDEPDQASQTMIEGLQSAEIKTVVVGGEYLGWSQDKYNIGYANCRQQSEWIVTMADDCELDRPGWIDAALKVNKKGFVGLYCGDRPADTFAGLYMATRHYIDTVMEGLVGLPWYHVWCADMEWCERAKGADAFVVCQEAHYIHHRDAIPVKQRDHIYKMASQWYAEDLKTYGRLLKGKFDKKLRYVPTR